jgi:RNA polymerase sigma-70 factor (ECF subfamily)
MAAVRDGHRESFALIFERYRSAIWGFFRRRAPDPDVAAELTQDVFVAVLEAAPRYQARGAFRSYLFGVALNTLSTWRRKTHGSAGTLPLGDLDPPAVAVDPECSGSVARSPNWIRLTATSSCCASTRR